MVRKKKELLKDILRGRTDEVLSLGHWEINGAIDEKLGKSKFRQLNSILGLVSVRNPDDSTQSGIGVKA